MQKRMNNQTRLKSWEIVAATFLTTIWQKHDQGYVFIGTRDADNRKWQEHKFSADVSKKKLHKFFGAYPSDRYDLYFCPNAFSKAHRKTDYGLPTSFAWSDIDGADPNAFEPKPSVLWESSPGRYQGLWIWDQTNDPHIAEAISKQLAYRHGADKNGWSVTKYLRIPGTLNHKSNYNRPRVELVGYNFSPQLTPKITHARKSQKSSKKISRSTLLRDEPQALQDAINILRNHKPTLRPRIQAVLKTLSSGRKYRIVPSVDRSVKVHQTVRSLHQSGLSEGEILRVMWIEPHFRDKHGAQFEILVQEVERILGKLEDRA